MKKQSEDMELLKTKLKDKDSYIQKQSTKIFRLQALVDKSNQEMLLLKKNNPVNLNFFKSHFFMKSLT